MSREFSRSRTHSPAGDDLRILNLDSSPGSSRRHGEEGADKGVHIPNFSKEVSLDSEEDHNKNSEEVPSTSDDVSKSHLTTSPPVPKSVSPKSILKRRSPDQIFHGFTETREKTKCCHPLVNKIKHLADKTLQKLERNDNEKSPQPKRKKDEENQDIRQLKTSPGAARRQKFSAIKLGDSDEMSKNMSVDSTPPSRKKKDHIYEDIDESKSYAEKSLHFSPDVEERDVNNERETDSIFEKKSNASQDPSLVAEDGSELKPEEHIMEKLHKMDDTKKEIVPCDDDGEEPNVDEIFQNQLEETTQKDGSPNITITEITDDTGDMETEPVPEPRIDTSPSPQEDIADKNSNVSDMTGDWSKSSSDHEYEIIEKPSTDTIFSSPIVSEKVTMTKTDDELSSTTSLERKFLQHQSDDDELQEDKENFDDSKDEGIRQAEALQKNIEEQYFANTPSVISRTECEVSTSQVDSSALENLPLKRGSRNKNNDGIDSMIQQRIREGTGKLKTQAGKLKTKLQNIKASMPDRPKINLPDRPKFKMPERPKINLPERPKFSLPDRRKFSLPDRPKFKKINISEKLSMGDRKKFTLPDRPKFNVPDMPKFKLPDRSKLNFSSLGRKKEYKIKEPTPSNSDLSNAAPVEYEAKTYPRLFNRKKKSAELAASSSPAIDREDTPPPVFTFTRMKKTENVPSNSSEGPREYGMVDDDDNYHEEMAESKDNEKYDYEKEEAEYTDDNKLSKLQVNGQSSSIPNISPSNQEYSHVINEINNDEFFVRPRGISRENIQMREYLSDEIRQAFKIPKNALSMLGSTSKDTDSHHLYNNDDVEADPELMLDENEPGRYSNEDLQEKDDGYYTFPPVRPSRAKRKQRELDSVKYIDESVTASMQFSEVDLGLPDQTDEQQHYDNGDYVDDYLQESNGNELNDSRDHRYANQEMFEYEPNNQIESQTLPMPPKRKKKSKSDILNSSYNDFTSEALWKEPEEQTEDIIVYRTEHEYIVPQTEIATEQSPLPPRRSRNHSRSSRGTSLCDDDRTSHGAESLTLDTHIPPLESTDIEREIRHESPGYATVDKRPNSPSKATRRSKSKTPPPVRRRKSSDVKYYTVGPTKAIMPDRPPRKKSSTSLMTLDNISKRSLRSLSGDITPYDEIDELPFEEVHKGLVSGEVINKMKDRPLPPPPRPPRGSRRRKNNDGNDEKANESNDFEAEIPTQEEVKSEEVVEIEVSTQTDPLPDDVDYELGMDENIDISMSSSIRDVVDEDHINMSPNKLTESPRVSRPTSRSEKSFKLSDPKISELSKSTLGRTSPTVILVERRVSSPTRINEHEEMLTEASLTVQHIDLDESKIPDVPPLPMPRNSSTAKSASKKVVPSSTENALDLVAGSRDVQLDNLITQRLQVRDLDVGRLNVSELQASKILVSDIEGMTLQVTELDSKSGHISVSGIEFSQNIIDEIVKKFAELTTPTASTSQQHDVDNVRPVSREEHTQTEQPTSEANEVKTPAGDQQDAPVPPPRPVIADESTPPPQRPPPPDLTPLLYSYLQDLTQPSGSFYHMRPTREKPFTEFHESLHQSPPPPSRRVKRERKQTHTAPHSESSSDDERPRRSPRRAGPVARAHEPTITEAGAQFLRVCHNSISRTIRNIFNSFMSYVSGTEDKKDVQMALVIFLVLIAGLIMFGLSDSRTIHHHHWEFFNPPEGKP
ncbi:uncharacterized protein LOC105394749 isoform X2 [Plutella xylostella]|nr:uncharacterized protein LOC105394749 isoform X2 [Plutella xylostella]